jgi:hypothetical protein
MRGLFVLVLALAAGCSGLKTYPSDAGGNLAVRSQMDSGVKGALHIHRVNAKCETQYVGTVQLDRPSLALSLPPGQATYLVVAFDTSSFLGGTRSTSAGMLLTPRSASRYDLVVRYHDAIYDVALSEADGRARRVLARRDLSECRTGS